MRIRRAVWWYRWYYSWEVRMWLLRHNMIHLYCAWKHRKRLKNIKMSDPDDARGIPYE